MESKTYKLPSPVMEAFEQFYKDQIDEYLEVPEVVQRLFELPGIYCAIVHPHYITLLAEDGTDFQDLEDDICEIIVEYFPSFEMSEDETDVRESLESFGLRGRDSLTVVESEEKD